MPVNQSTKPLTPTDRVLLAVGGFLIVAMVVDGLLTGHTWLLWAAAAGALLNLVAWLVPSQFTTKR